MENIKFELHQVATGQILLAAYGRVKGGEGFLLTQDQVNNISSYGLKLENIRGFNRDKYQEFYLKI